MCTDVRKLTRAWLRAHKVHETPEAIIAGFPCVGFSLVGRRQGYKDEQNGLFLEILRIGRASEFCFSRTSRLRDGMELLVKELHTRRGFRLAWCIVAASDVGAPQQRRRWFCVAQRGALPPAPPLFSADGYRPFTQRWAKEPAHRTTCPGGPSKSPLSEQQLRGVRSRLRLLGNSVVPMPRATHSSTYWRPLSRLCIHMNNKVRAHGSAHQWRGPDAASCTVAW